jgi:signal transduction histidine kinase
VKSFVELHGGDVQIESEPEEGTAIVCHLPRRAQTPAPEGNAA